MACIFDAFPLWKNVLQELQFDEPWNSQHNLALAKEMPGMFRCPAAYLSDPDVATQWTTNFVAITGPGTIWEKRIDKNGKEIGQDKVFTDDPANTILLVETIDSGIHWMEPRDLTIEEVPTDENGFCLPATSNHYSRDGYFVVTIRQSGGHVIMADGSVHYLPGRISREDLEALLTTDGGESVSLDDIGYFHGKESETRRIVWAHCIAFPLFWLSLVVLVLSTKITPKKNQREVTC